MQYVYKIQAGNFIKIGIANDVRSRISQLQTGNPYRLELLSCYGFDDAYAVERALHQAYAKSRGVGEWFELTAKQSDDFEIICQMLGGERSYFDDNVSNEEIEEADVMAQSVCGKTWYELVKVNRWYYLREMGWDAANGKKVYVKHIGSLEECKSIPEYSEIAYKLEAIKFAEGEK